MTEFSKDFRPIFSAGTTARTSLLDLIPKVESVDGYAGSTFKSSVESVLKLTDSVRQVQRETATDLNGIIDTWLMIHNAANDPSLQNDIIDECTNMLKTLSLSAPKSDTTEKINAIGGQVLNIKNALESTISDKDKAIKAELDASSKNVSDLEDQIAPIDAKLEELRSKVNQSGISKVLGAGKALASGGDNEAAIREQIRKLEAERSPLQGQLDTARERKRQAVAVSDARDTARRRDPVAGASSAQTKTDSWVEASKNLIALHKAFSTEILTYQGAFQANKNDPSDPNKKALADEIRKVDGFNLGNLKLSLGEGANNL